MVDFLHCQKNDNLFTVDSFLVEIAGVYHYNPTIFSPHIGRGEYFSARRLILALSVLLKVYTCLSILPGNIERHVYKKGNWAGGEGEQLKRKDGVYVIK